MPQDEGYRPETYGERPHVAPESSPKPEGSSHWECLSCNQTFDRDHGTCPNCGAPLRKAGRVAASGQAQKIAPSDDNIDRPASSLDETSAGAKEATRSDEPSDDPRLYGERPADDRTIGGSE